MQIWGTEPLAPGVPGDIALQTTGSFEAGPDALTGAVSGEVVQEGANDRLFGGAGDDRLFGGAGDDLIRGGEALTGSMAALAMICSGVMLGLTVFACPRVLMRSGI